MRITFLGTGSAMPTGERYQTGIVVREMDQTLLIDCGSGILHRLQQFDIGYEAIDSVLLTHHHLDHVADLLPLMKARWLAGSEQLEIAGPTGTKHLVDQLLDVFDYMQDRLELHVRDIAEQEFELAGFSIRSFETRHSIRCLAYRFDDRFAFSGDSEAFEGLTSFLDGSAVVAHDCSFPDGIDVANHPTPAELGSVLADSDIGRVYLTHLYPHTIGHEEEMIKSITSTYEGEVKIAHDGLSISVSQET